MTRKMVEMFIFAYMTRIDLVIKDCTPELFSPVLIVET